MVCLVRRGVQNFEPDGLVALDVQVCAGARLTCFNLDLIRSTLNIPSAHASI